MSDSLSLGLLHGALYGITPIAPWFIAFKNFFFHGREKALAMYVGVLAGQLLLLTLTFTGCRELLWLWWYLEPLLVLLGLFVCMLTVRQCFSDEAYRISQIDRLMNVERGQRRWFFAGGAGLAFCNPGNLLGTQALLGVPPTNISLYLFAFGVTCTCAMGVAWLIFDRELSRDLKQGGLQAISRLRGTGTEDNLGFFKVRPRRQTRRISLALMICVYLQCSTLPDEGVRYYGDHMFSVLGIEQAVDMTSRDFIWFNSSPEGEHLTHPPTEEQASENKYTKQSVSDYNDGEHPDVEEDYGAQELWDMEDRYAEIRKNREKKTPGDLARTEREFMYEETFKHDLLGIIPRLKRLELYLMPDWERQTIPYITRLEQIRRDTDQMFVEPTHPRFKTIFLPDRPEFEADYDFEEAKEKDWATDKKYAGIVTELEKHIAATGPSWNAWNHHDVHRSNAYAGGLSSVKLQTLPKAMNMPWDFPQVEVEKPYSPTTLPLGSTDTEAIASGNDALTMNFKFLNPLAFNARVWENEPLSFEEQTAKSYPEKFQRVPRNAFRRLLANHDLWEESRPPALVPGQEIWPVRRTPTTQFR